MECWVMPFDKNLVTYECEVCGEVFPFSVFVEIPSIGDIKLCCEFCAEDKPKITRYFVDDYEVIKDENEEWQWIEPDEYEIEDGDVIEVEFVAIDKEESER